ncbi:MAG: hypothetical protein JW794_07615 [Candidatus Cloacimonetes bacterium]|nr:hypothetical protein [Candidatus Cloacimonadota bacterium]
MKKIILFIGLFGLLACSSLPKYVELQSTKDANEITKRAQKVEADGKYFQAQLLFEKAYDLYSSVDNLKGIIISGLSVARQYYYLDNMEQYDDWYMKMSVIAHNDAPDLIPLLYLLQMEVAFDKEEYGRVITLSLAVETNQKEMQTELLSYRLLALLKTEQPYNQEFDKVKRNIPALRSMFKKNKLDDPKIIPYAAYTLGYALSKEKQWIKAIEFFEIAHEYDQLIENTGGLADDVYAIGVAYENLMDAEMALSCYIRARDMYVIIDDEEMSAVAEARIKNILE